MHFGIPKYGEVDLVVFVLSTVISASSIFSVFHSFLSNSKSAKMMQFNKSIGAMMWKVASYGLKMNPFFTVIPGAGSDETQLGHIFWLGTVWNFKS